VLILLYWFSSATGLVFQAAYSSNISKPLDPVPPATATADPVPSAAVTTGCHLKIIKSVYLEVYLEAAVATGCHFKVMKTVYLEVQ
jgi:hypothetical protein